MARAGTEERRTVGVEIEFAGLSELDAVRIASELFGGEIEAHGRNRYEVFSERIGLIRAELDTRLADRGEQHEAGELETKARQIVGKLGSAIIPIEITMPPLAVEDLPLVDRLVTALHEAGAEGTGQSLTYGFGVHLNPEIEDCEPHALCGTLAAFALSSAWLFHDVQMDFTRRVLRYAVPFPESYTALVARPDYRPDLERLIDDYVAHNPTRDRALDALPVLAFLRPEKIAEALPSEPVKARPTWHYRLPNAALNEPGWSIVKEWRRWCVVEDLAADAGRLDATRRAFREQGAPAMSPAWREKSLAFIGMAA